MMYITQPGCWFDPTQYLWKFHNSRGELTATVAAEIVPELIAAGWWRGPVPPPGR